ncbi:MAG: hypothetical protein KIS94_09985 [Chitinophagales bacterium]|nr:hypothetical protein [Chitinophagales bacterium]
MKTTVLKWDYRIQVVLGLVNLACVVVYWQIPYLLLFMQVVIGAYQLISSLLHLCMQHKSVGFVGWRMGHFFGSLAYLLFLGWLVWLNALNTVVFISCFMIIPQVVIYTYILLCKKELNYLLHREFFILK